MPIRYPGNYPGNKSRIGDKPWWEERIEKGRKGGRAAKGYAQYRPGYKIPGRKGASDRARRYKAPKPAAGYDQYRPGYQIPNASDRARGGAAAGTGYRAAPGYAQYRASRGIQYPTGTHQAAQYEGPAQYEGRDFSTPYGGRRQDKWRAIAGPGSYNWTLHNLWAEYLASLEDTASTDYYPGYGAGYGQSYGGRRYGGGGGGGSTYEPQPDDYYKNLVTWRI